MTGRSFLGALLSVFAPRRRRESEPATTGDPEAPPRSGAPRAGGGLRRSNLFRNDELAERGRERWSDGFLDRMKDTGDPLADETVAAIHEAHGTEAVNRALQALIASGTMPPEIPGLSPEVADRVRAYYEESGRLPDWADPERVRRGEEFFEGHAPLAALLLGVASLPELYTCGQGGTQVLGATLELELHVRRRIFGTAQLLIDTMGGGGLDAERAKTNPHRYGRGIRAAQKVRLMHAAVRHLIQAHPAEPRDRPEVLGHALQRRAAARIWRPEWGVPIGQEYNGATLQTFSYVIIRGLEHMGVEVQDDEAEAYIHCWNVLGHILGIPDDFLDPHVTTMDDAAVLYSRIMARKQSRTPEEAKDGVALTRALMNFLGEMLEESVPMGRHLPLRDFPLLLTVDLVGTDTARLLGIELSAAQRAELLAAERALAEIDEHWPLAHRHLGGDSPIARWVAWHLFRHFMRLKKEWSDELFFMPDHLARPFVQPA